MSWRGGESCRAPRWDNRWATTSAGGRQRTRSLIYLDSSVALAICSPKIVFRPKICGGSSWYQAVSLNTRCGTGFMLAGSIGLMAMLYER